MDVTVVGLSGDILLGPEALARENLLQDLRTRLLDGRVGQEVHLMLKGALVDAEEAFDGMTELQLEATFSEFPLEFSVTTPGQGGLYTWTDTLSVEKAEDLPQKQDQRQQGSRMWTEHVSKLPENIAVELGRPTAGREVTASQIEVFSKRSNGKVSSAIELMQREGIWTNPDAEWPEYLTVVSPEDQKEKAGYYSRDHSRNRYGLPVWKQVHSESPQFSMTSSGIQVTDGSNVIYSHSCGLWMIGPERKMSDERGGIVSKSKHCGMHPGNIEEWRAFADAGFKVDDRIKVFAVDGHRDLKYNPKFQWYTYSEDEMSGIECLAQLHGYKAEALASYPDKAEAVFKLVEKQPSITVEMVQHEANHNEECKTVFRIPGYKITVEHDKLCHR